jgi:hypothetical protein
MIRNSPLLTKGRGEAGPALLCCPIHPSAWNMNSANFAFWAFSEVELRIDGVLRSSAIIPNSSPYTKV